MRGSGGYRRRLALAIALVGAATLAAAENIDPAGDGSRYAWAENVGWLSAELDTDHDGTPDEGVEVRDFELLGWMWGENVGWVSLSCKNTDSCWADYGVRNDGQGFLHGFAWAENAGWISFSCQDTASCHLASYGVTIDPATGIFDGHAWGENVGWIRFRSSGPTPFALETAWRCDPGPPPPAGSPTLWLIKPGGEIVLTWSDESSGGATGYDVVYGDLRILRDPGGGFVPGTTWCLDDNLASLAMIHDELPTVDEGFWYLVRGVNCAHAGTYDTGEPSQFAPRDEDIAASGNDCP